MESGTVTKNLMTLGEILLASKKIKQEELDKALTEQKNSGKKLGKILIEMGFMEEEEVFKFLSLHLRIPLIDLSNFEIDHDIIKLVPEKIIRKYLVFPIFKKFNVLILAVVDPLDVDAIDNVSFITRYEIEPVLCTETAMREFIDQFFGKIDLVEETLKGITNEESFEYVEEEENNDIEENKLRDIALDTPVIRYVNNLIIQAIRESASDIHIEPDEKVLRVRFRIDGILHEIPSPPKKMQLPIISRIKIMAKMDIANMRIPQDGRFDVKIDGRDVSLRISTFPTFFGENVVIRILDKTLSNYGIDSIGLSLDDQERLEKIIKKRYGFILATGPTGSGKTTTLYALIKCINSVEKNIVTIEDPIEYTISMIRQSQVNTKAGLSFETGLRAVLRQDPDLIMVGEIRDRETSSIAIQSALTGHMVFSTLHTNDAPSAVTRLIEIGNEPYLVASSLSAVIAQRLVRTICEKCKEPYTPSHEFLKDVGISPQKDFSLYQGKGCDNCKQTGFKGRTAISEILIIDKEIRELIMEKASSDKILTAAIKAGMSTMKENAFAKAAQGIVDINEAMSVIKTD
ncbi:MAG: GspE/PulE family protein [bacterium]